MSEHWNLTLESGEMKGNNTYQLNRTTIDPRFRSSQTPCDIANIQGYSATGDIIYKNQTYQGPQSTTTASAVTLALNEQKKPQQTISAINQSNNFALYDEPIQPIQPIQPCSEPFINQQRSKHMHKKHRIHRHNCHNAPVSQPTDLQQLTQSRYNSIMNENSGLPRY
jgi:hypothetical protein